MAAEKEPPIEPAKHVADRIDPVTGATIKIYDNPEGAALKEKSDQSNARVRTFAHRGWGVGGAAVGGESGRKRQSDERDT